MNANDKSKNPPRKPAKSFRLPHKNLVMSPADLAAAKARDKANALPRPIIWPVD